MNETEEKIADDVADGEAVDYAQAYCKAHTNFEPGKYLVIAIIEGFLTSKAERGIFLSEPESEISQ